MATILRIPLLLLTVWIGTACNNATAGPDARAVAAIVDSIEIVPEPFTTARVTVNMYGRFDPARCATAYASFIRPYGDTLVVEILTQPASGCIPGEYRFAMSLPLLSNPPRTVTILAYGQGRTRERIFRSFRLPLADSAAAP